MSAPDAEGVIDSPTSSERVSITPADADKELWWRPTYPPSPPSDVDSLDETLMSPDPPGEGAPPTIGKRFAPVIPLINQENEARKRELFAQAESQQAQQPQPHQQPQPQPQPQPQA